MTTSTLVTIAILLAMARYFLSLKREIDLMKKLNKVVKRMEVNP